MALVACGNSSATKVTETNKQEASEKTELHFDADSAYAFVAQQVAFGPRVPNSKAHRDCGDWLVAKLAEYGASNITEQTAQVKAYNGTTLDIRNITAQYRPELAKRVLLMAHWDTRPWADHDPDPAMRTLPFDGANDGASGVAVILELARNMAQNAPAVGVDILFTDAEDYGARDDDSKPGDEAFWCLGTQYWANNPTLDLSKIRYGVLLDMVGGKDAVFPREYFSDYKASEINDKVWKAAASLGHGKRFANSQGMPVVDDHLPLLSLGVPVIDIIECDHPETNSFNPTWHTKADNLSNIDPETLRAVGETLWVLISNR